MNIDRVKLTAQMMADIGQILEMDNKFKNLSPNRRKLWQTLYIRLEWALRTGRMHQSLASLTAADLLCHVEPFIKGGKYKDGNVA